MFMPSSKYNFFINISIASSDIEYLITNRSPDKNATSLLFLSALSDAPCSLPFL